MILHIKRIKKKTKQSSQVILKTMFDKIQHPVRTKPFKTLGIKRIYNKPRGDTMLYHGDLLKASPAETYQE